MIEICLGFFALLVLLVCLYCCLQTRTSERDKPTPLHAIELDVNPMTCEPTTRTFPGTKVPARVVCTFYVPNVQQLDRTLQESLNSWRTDETGFKPDIVYYNDTHAREFLAHHFAQEGGAKAWDALVPGAFKADVFRICEIFVNGGLYCDIKCTRIAPFAALVGSHGTITLDQLEMGLWNGFFAAPPRAVWVGACVARILANVRNRSRGTSMLDITGPSAMGRSFRVQASLPENTTSCEFVRKATLDDWSWYQQSERIRIIAMRASDTSMFDVVSGLFAPQAAFRTDNEAYRVPRRVDNPKLHYGFAYENNLMYVADTRLKNEKDEEEDAY